MTLVGAAVFARVAALGEAFWWTKCLQRCEALSILAVITASPFFHPQLLSIPRAQTEMRLPAASLRWKVPSLRACWKMLSLAHLQPSNG